MGKYIAVENRKAEGTRKVAVRLGLLDSSRQLRHSRSYVYFPTVDIRDEKAIKLLSRAGARIVSMDRGANAKADRYPDNVKRAMGDEEFSKLSRGYDLLGDIAIIEFTGKAANRRAIANALMDSNRAIRTVLLKAGPISGRYRTRKLSFIAGKRNYTADYRENGCTFRFDVRKVFFSNRLSFERSRILGLVKARENVVVMFAGIGPFAIEIAKAVKGSKVIAMELNRQACRHMEENARLNKTPNVEVAQGDVHRLSGKYKGVAQRIIMPLPKSSLDYLDDVYAVASRKAMVHIYSFVKSDDMFDGVIKRIREHAKKRGYKVVVKNKRVVRPYSARECEVVVDYLMSKR